MIHRRAPLALLAMLALSPIRAAEATDPAAADLATVAPGLAHYDEAVVRGDLWKRPGLSPRDRSIVTVSALIATGQTAALGREFGRALDDGVSPAEVGAIITHLAFYVGWPDALSAAGAAKRVFAARGIAAKDVAAPDGRLPYDAAADQQRVDGVEKAYGSVSPSIVRYTNELLFKDLWLRKDLRPRDRSLVTISALIAGRHAEQLPFHVDRGLDNGLTRGEIGEAVTQLAFYAGWPSALSAVPIIAATFGKRPG